MDFIKAPAPSSSTSRSSGSNSDDGDTETGRINEPFGLVSNTFKDLYDYIALETGNSGLFSDASLFSITNDTFLEINANLGSGLSAANGTALTLLQSNLTASVVSIAAAAATVAVTNGTASDPTAASGAARADVHAKGLQDTLGGGGGTGDDDDFSKVLLTTVTSIILGLMILITVIGNVFVIAAIILERNLQNVANYLVASLAVADLFVACLVMPLGAVYEICGWILGPALCDIWTSCDVLCCTASILHLVAIATDRYWAVTNVDYIHSRTSNRVFTMIFLVWFSAVVVSLAPQFGWKDPEYLQRIQEEKCMVSQDVAYQVFATCCTFYVPLFVILVLYWKIYQTARKRIRRRRHDKPTSDNASQSTPNPKSASTSRIPFRLARFTTQGRSTLGLVEGNSTNTVNTVEDTEFSSNEKEKKGIEVTSFNNSDEGPTTTTTTLTTAAAPTMTMMKTSITTSLNQPHSQHHLHPLTMTTTTTTTTPVTTSQCPETTQSATTDPSAVGQQQQVPHQINTVSHFIVCSQSMENDQNGNSIGPVNNNNNNNNSSKPPNNVTSTNGRQSSPTSQQHPQHLIQLVNQSQQQHLLQHQPTSACPSQVSTPVQHCTVISTTSQSANNPQTQVTKRKETLEAKRERKAAKTLAIITGAFVVCWLPFFITALLMPLCTACEISDTLFSFFLWLGYFNSTLNPVIYTIFSPEFRQAFKRILFGGHRNSYYRSGKF